MARRVLPLLAVAVVVFFGALAPIRSYDYFWHLATGRWIVEHRALPERDPFSVGSDHEPWINGEWLYQVVLWSAETQIGHDGISVLHAFLLAAFFGLLFAYAQQRASDAVAGLLTVLAFFGGAHRLSVRPETAGTILLAAFTCLALAPPGRSRLFGLAALAAVWINIHPSALLAPLLVAAAAVGDRFRERATAAWSGDSLTAVAAVSAALLVNPYGFEGVMAPVRLVQLVSGGEFINREWLPSHPSRFPLLYVAVAGGLVLLGKEVRRRRHVAEALIFTLLAVLAIRHVRNHGFFYALLPILVSGAVPELRTTARRVAGVAAAVLAAIIVAGRLPLAVGIDDRLFPVRAVDRLIASRLAGNVFNADQFGGYLIHRFYPERRTIVDGRNELHEAYLARYARARLDEREWRKLLDDYEITLAVDEYHRETIDVINPVSGRREVLPASLIYFPRREWALIAFDDAAMVFARRSRHPEAVIDQLEYPTLVPDGVRQRAEPERAARELRDLARVKREVGESGIRRRMELRAKREIEAGR